MRTLHHLVAAILVITVGSTAAFAQQRHAVDSASLAETVRHHAAAQDADRAMIHETLAQPEVRRAAAAAGIDLDRVSARVDTLAPADLNRAAASALDVNRSLTSPSLVGGASTVTISTTTIIIGLLVLILLIVALD